MQNSNELLYQILQVVGKIESNQRSTGKTTAASAGPSGAGDGSISSKLGGAVKSFSGVGSKATKTFFSFLKGMMEISTKAKDKDVKKMHVVSESLGLMGNALPSIAEGLGDLGKIRAKQVERAIWSLDQLYDFMAEAGEARNRRKVENAIKTFEKMGKSLKDISKPVKDISFSFAYLGLGILALAGSLILSSMLLGLSKPTDVLLFLGGLVVGVLLMFGLLWMANKIVDKGTDVIKDIGLGMAALSLGILSFAITIVLLPKILGGESGGSIAKSLLIMVGIVAAMAFMFMILGALKNVTFKGFVSILFMSAGLMILSIAILGLAMTAKLLMTGMTPTSASKEEKDENKKFIMKGLGVMGLIILAAVGLFALLGIPVVAGLVMLGSATMIMMSVALILMATSVKKLVETAKALDGEDIGERLSTLIGGTLSGFIGGLSVLSGGKKGVAGIAEFIKNSAKIFAGTAVLMSMSLALSQFAKAITAFAELENMRIIEGYDKDGKPIFGQKVNVSQVASNITYSISTFLEALLASTEGLTKDKAAAIRKMGRALTGKRGILSAVIQFADALKVYAEFGENNEIGYIDYDDNGNEIRKKVSAAKVVDNMIGSFLYFTDRLFNKSDEEFGDGEPGESGISGRQKRRMKRMSKALIGKNGILGAVMQFADVLKLFSEFGTDNQLPILDADGKPVMEGGKPKTLSVGNIADNIVSALTTFSDSLATKLETKGNVKDATKSIEKYEGMINQLSKLSSSMDGLSKMTASIQGLADGIGDLAVNIEKMDAEKLTDVLKRISDGSLEISASGKSYAGSSSSSTSTSSGKARETATTSKNGEPKWDVIAAQIGLAVGQQITDAMKKGQLKFEFSGTGSNKGILELD
jgi:hypothetical protein